MDSPAKSLMSRSRHDVVYHLESKPSTWSSSCTDHRVDLLVSPAKSRPRVGQTLSKATEIQQHNIINDDHRLIIH